MHIASLVALGFNTLASKWWSSSVRRTYVTNGRYSRTRRIIQLLDKLALGWSRQYLRQLERRQVKALDRQAVAIRKLHGGAGAEQFVKRIYSRRIYVLDIIHEVVSPFTHREALTVPELQLVALEFLRQRIIGPRSQLPSSDVTAK